MWENEFPFTKYIGVILPCAQHMAQKTVKKLTGVQICANFLNMNPSWTLNFKTSHLAGATAQRDTCAKEEIIGDFSYLSWSHSRLSRLASPFWQKRKYFYIFLERSLSLQTASVLADKDFCSPLSASLYDWVNTPPPERETLNQKKILCRGTSQVC